MMDLVIAAVALAQTIQTPPWESMTVAGLLGLIVMSFVNEWVVPGKQYRREREAQEKEVEFWRDMALDNLGLADKAVTLAERQVSR